MRRMRRCSGASRPLDQAAPLERADEVDLWTAVGCPRYAARSLLGKVVGVWRAGTAPGTARASARAARAGLQRGPGRRAQRASTDRRSLRKRFFWWALIFRRGTEAGVADTRCQHRALSWITPKSIKAFGTGGDGRARAGVFHGGLRLPEWRAFHAAARDELLKFLNWAHGSIPELVHAQLVLRRRGSISSLPSTWTFHAHAATDRAPDFPFGALKKAGFTTVKFFVVCNT